MNRRTFIATIGLGATALACGCKPKAPYGLVPVSGVVTYQGKPLDDRFHIEFQNTDGSRPSIARIGEGGKFEAVHTASQKGVKPGSNKVIVYWNADATTTPVPDEFKPMMDKYGFTGSDQLTIEITKKESKLEVKFE